jgi:CheY-like chemotaxis protein/HPt (histidine-containing phosphotransfer) domain-containing protein
LPGCDAAAVEEQIRKQLRARRPVPILSLSWGRLRGEEAQSQETRSPVAIHKPLRPAQLLDALCRTMSVQILRDKKAPLTPLLDSTLAERFPMELLLADDNPINQKVGVTVLQKLGYRANLASNGVEVLKALEEKAYDLVFLDVQMPEMDGLEAARRICERWPAEQRPLIVAMTGNALLGDREKCLAAGMDDYISKPVRVGELQAIIERWGPARRSRAAEPRQPVETNKWVDLAVIQDLRAIAGAGGRTMLDELVGLFLAGAPARLAEIRNAKADAERLAFQAHALKGMSLNLGASAIVEICQELENLARSGKLDTVHAALDKLQVAVAETEATLRSLESRPRNDSSRQLQNRS